MKSVFSKVISLLMLVAVGSAAPAQAAVSNHLFGPYTGPTFTTEGSWVTQNLPVNGGQPSYNFNAITNVAWSWSAAGDVCYVQPIFGGCSWIETSLPAGFQVKLCMDPSVPGGEGWGCANITGAQAGTTAFFNGRAYAVSAPKVSIKLFVPAGAATDRIRGTSPGWANGVTIERMH